MLSVDTKLSYDEVITLFSGEVIFANVLSLRQGHPEEVFVHWTIECPHDSDVTDAAIIAGIPGRKYKVL